MSLAQNLMSQSISRSDFCVSAVVIVVVDDKEKEEIVDNVVKVDENFLNPGRLTLGWEGVVELAMDVVDIMEKVVDNAAKIKMF